VHLTVGKAAAAVGEGFGLGGVLGLLVESVHHPTTPLTYERMGNIVIVAGYFALLGSLFGLVFYLASNGH